VSRFVEKIAFERGKETLTMARIVYRHLSTFYTWALTRLEHMPANPCRMRGARSGMNLEIVY
jgi:hypothetical protein